MDTVEAVPSFEAIHSDFRPRVLRYLAGFVGPAEADDLAQITMLKVSEHLAQFRRESSLATWILRIARNVALDHLRQRTAQTVAIATSADDETSESVPDCLQAPAAETSAIQREISDCVRGFVAALPAQYATVLVLSEVQGLTDSEIAQATGLSVATVKIRLHRARARLRADLQAGCTTHRDERNELACDRRHALA